MNCSAPTRRKKRGSHNCRTAFVLDALRAAKGLAAQRVSRARTRRNVHANWERQKKGYGQPRKGSKAVATKPHKPPMPLHAPPPDKWPYAPDRSNKCKRGKNCREAESDHPEKKDISRLGMRSIQGGPSQKATHVLSFRTCWCHAFPTCRLFF